MRYPNVFAAGDVASTPNSKTAVIFPIASLPSSAPHSFLQAAVTRQVPVLVHNMTQLMNGRALTAKFDGYASCPLLVGDGRVILAEFVYGGVPQEVRADRVIYAVSCISHTADIRSLC